MDLSQLRLGLELPKGIPAKLHFNSLADTREHRKKMLIVSFLLFVRFGFNEGVVGHITAHDLEKNNHFWVNPFGVDFGSIKVSKLRYLFSIRNWSYTKVLNTFKLGRCTERCRTPNHCVCLIKISFILFYISYAQALMAQDYVDLVRVNYSNTSQNNFKNNVSSTRVQEYGIEATVPVAINGNTNFLTGFIYEAIKTKLDFDQNEQNFSSITLKLGFNKTHSENWSGTYMLLPKIASDFQKITKKAFQVGGVALLKYKKNDQLSYKAGLYANAELFGPWVVPLFGLYYQSANKKLEANVTLPLLADMNYALHKSAALGINFFGQVRTYHLISVLGTGNSGYVTRSTNELFAYLKLNLTKGLIIQTKFGHSLGRNYRVYNEGDKVSFGLPLHYFGDNRQQLNTDFKDGWLYQFVVLYRFHRNP